MDQSTLQSFLIVYVLLLVATIMFAIKKKTHWSSIIMVALLPICFIFVLWDAFRSSDTGKQEESSPDEINRDGNSETATLVTKVTTKSK